MHNKQSNETLDFDEIDLKYFCALVKRRKYIVIAVIAVFLLIGVTKVITKPKEWISNAVIAEGKLQDFGDLLNLGSILENRQVSNREWMSILFSEFSNYISSPNVLEEYRKKYTKDFDSFPTIRITRDRASGTIQFESRGVGSSAGVTEVLIYFVQDANRNFLESKINDGIFSLQRQMKKIEVEFEINFEQRVDMLNQQLRLAKLRRAGPDGVSLAVDPNNLANSWVFGEKYVEEKIKALKNKDYESDSRYLLLSNNLKYLDSVAGNEVESRVFRYLQEPNLPGSKDSGRGGAILLVCAFLGVIFGLLLAIVWDFYKKCLKGY